MNKNEYIKSVFDGLRCDKKVKNSLYKEYSDKIDERVNLGMTMAEIIAELGTPATLHKDIVEKLNQNNLLIDRKVFILSKILSGIQYMSVCAFAIIVLYSIQQRKQFNDFIAKNAGADTFIYGYSYIMQIILISIVILFFAICIIKYAIYSSRKHYLNRNHLKRICCVFK